MSDPFAPIEALADDLGGHATDFHRGTAFRLRAAIAEARAQMSEEWGTAYADRDEVAEEL